MVWIFVFILFSTFFNKTADFSLPKIMNFAQSGVQSYGSWSQEFTHSRFSIYDSVYVNEASFTGELVYAPEDVVQLAIEKDKKYVSSFRDMSKQYVFQGEWYKMLQEWIGEVFIDTLSVPGKIFVMPLNTSLHLTLTDSSGENEYTHIYLQPHMYLEFRPAHGKFLKNADVVRIETVNTLGYYPKEISQAPLDDDLQKYFGDEVEFFHSTFQKIQDENFKKSKTLMQVMSQDVWKVPGFDMIERYMNLFVNEEKKKVFYKNNILRQIVLMVQNETYNETVVKKLEQDLDRLKKLDQDSYKDMLEIIEHLSVLVYSHYEKDYLIPKVYFADLLSTGDQSVEWYYKIYGFSLYSKYDYTKEFLPFYAQRYQGALEKFNASKKETSQYFTLRYQYFSYFLDKQLEFLLSGPAGDNPVVSINNTLENLIDAISISYGDESTDRVTALYIYSGVLKNLEAFVRYSLFEKNRNDRNLLEAQKNIVASKDEVNALSKHVATIDSFLNDSKLFLESTDSRDVAVRNEILTSLEAFEEYFSAMKNYEAYTKNYDVTIKWILGTDTFGNEWWLVLSQDHAREYLKQFVWVDISNVNIEIKNNFYYEISNLYIAGQKYSFDLYPLSYYKLENLYIDGIEKDFVYRLQNIQLDWDKEYETVPETEKDAYDFSRFFIITFASRSDDQINEFVVNENNGNEDKAQIVYKRDILLSDRGEFKTLSDVAEIEYKDIVLKDNVETKTYDIFLNDVTVRVDSPARGDIIKREWNVRGQYILADKHHFQKLELQILSELQDISNIYELDGKYIQIAGKVHIWDFKETLEDIYKYIWDYTSIYNNIIGKLWRVDIHMSYSPYNKKMSFKFDSDGKSYSIISTWGEVTSIYKWTQKLIDEPITSSQLLLYLE